MVEKRAKLYKKPRKRSIDIISEDCGDSPKQVQRYISLTSIILSGGKGSNYLLEHNIIAGMKNSSIINCKKIELSKLLWLIEHEWQKILKNKFIVNFFYFVVVI